VAIADAVAGRFDHYICRRDDNLRDRAPDEVPRIQSQALRAAGVPAAAVSIIPDEQEAIGAALRMAEAGDLLLIFADALARSWKQITKFKTNDEPQPGSAAHTSPALAPSPPTATESKGNGAGALPHHLAAAPTEAVPAFNLEGLIRDERGIRVAPESDD
jgi:cyanophycin synthetase